MTEHNHRVPLDRQRIDVEDRGERAWWCRRLNCSEEQLRNAVRAVGTSSDAVTRYLAEHTAENA